MKKNTIQLTLRKIEPLGSMK
uniref:Uncharacterized protein n=1 Tax=Anguilla anguilla TaxID=7936 RepID=A0A0E9PDT0_ANGAN